MSSNRTVIPIYTTSGDLGALMGYPYIYSPSGEWIGFVTPDREVYSWRGNYVGWLSGDPRILRKRSDEYDHPKRTPPPQPPTIRPPALAPLAPLMRELSFEVIDVLEDAPDLLVAQDFGELCEDMD